MKRLSKIQRALKAPKDQKGYGYTYRKASDILQAVKPLLEADQLAIIMDDRIIEVGGRFFLQANVTLYDEDGQEIVSSSAFAEMDDHKGMSKEQAIGSASSYARKYALCGLLAIDDSSNDPDGLERPGEPTKTANNAPAAKAPVDATKIAAIQRAVNEIKAAQDIEELKSLWSTYKQFQMNPDFVCAKDTRKKELANM
jgi:flagellar basal body rod protein FlgG